MAIFRELWQLVVDSKPDQMSFLLLSLFQLLNIRIKCFGCQGCQDSYITAALPLLVEKTTTLSHYQAPVTPQSMGSRRASSDAARSTEFDILYNLFTELPEMKEKHTLPSMSPGHPVLSEPGTGDLSNEPLMRKLGGELDSYGQTILHIVLGRRKPACFLSIAVQLLGFKRSEDPSSSA